MYISFIVTLYFSQHPSLEHPQPIEHRLRVFETRVLMLLGPRRGSVYEIVFFSAFFVNEKMEWSILRTSDERRAYVSYLVLTD